MQQIPESGALFNLLKLEERLLLAHYVVNDNLAWASVEQYLGAELDQVGVVLIFVLEEAHLTK